MTANDADIATATAATNATIAADVDEAIAMIGVDVDVGEAIAMIAAEAAGDAAAGEGDAIIDFEFGR